MKMKKILSVVVAMAITIGTMSFSAFALPEAPVAPKNVEQAPLALSDGDVAEVGGVSYTSIQEAINKAQDGDTVTIAAGVHSGFDISNKNITIQGSVGDDGDLLTTIKGGSPAILGHSFNGTIKDMKIVDAWSVMYAEPVGNVTVDNIYVTGAMYGLHLVAYQTGIKWTIQNSYMDLSWANSFGVHNGGYADIYIKNNTFDTTDPYYPSYGALAVNTFSPNVTVEDNVFGENTKIYVDKAAVTDTSNINIGANYYEDGVENAFADDAEGVTVKIDTYYSDLDENGNLTGFVDTAKTYAASITSADGKVTNYETLQEAVNVAAPVASETNPVTIQMLAGEFEQSITLPSNISYVTFKGADNYGTVLKNSSVGHSGGMNAVKKNLTFDGIDFYNSNINLTAIYENTKIENMTVKNCKFRDITGKAAVSINTNSLPNLVGFTFTGNTIENVGGGNVSGLILRAAPTGNIVITDNSITNVAWNAVQVIGATKDANVTITGNTLASGASEGILNLYNISGGVVLENNTFNTAEGQKEVGNFTPVAKNGNTYYTAIDTAIADAEDGDIITILAGTYNAFTVPADKNDLTFVGETDAEGNNLVTIKTNEADVATATTGIYVQSDKATFKNLNLESGSFIPVGTSGRDVWMAAAIGATNNGVGAGSSTLNDLTIENCHFKGNNANYAVWARACDIKIKDSTINGYAVAVETYASKAGQEVKIENTEITNVGNAIHTVSTQAGSLVTVKDSVIDTDMLHISGEGSMTMEGSVLNNVDVKTFGKRTLTITDSVLYSSAFSTYDDNSAIVLEKVFVDNVNEVAASENTYNVDFVTYYASMEDYTNKTNLREVPAATDAIFVQFEETAVGTEGEKTYNINLVATDDEIINRLNSVDLTFLFRQVSGENTYEIIESNSEVEINPVNNSTTRYEFHYKGKEGTITDTQKTINIGRVRFEGYGKFTFGVDSSKTTNVVHATTVADNIVDTFTPNGVVANGEGKLELGNGTGEVTIEVPTKDLTVNIAFPNAVKDNPIAYQDMKVVISGDDLAPVTIKLGEDAEKTAIVADNRVDAVYEADFVNGSYVVKVTDALTVNTSYDITVSGAGYRTARYTVRMTDNKIVNFWNNVKDADAAVEEGKAYAKLNYLAGDIVKDNKINTYDLSAVVSYFGETGLSATNNKDYAKYDLNRDGFIDSKDVAIVLVSWGN